MVRVVAGRTRRGGYWRAVGKGTAVVAPIEAGWSVVPERGEPYLVTRREVQLVGGGAPVEAHRQQPVGVHHEADAGADVRVRRGDGGRAHLAADPEAHDVAPAVDVVRADVELGVAEAVDPQHLADQLDAVLTRHRNDLRDERGRVHRLAQLGQVDAVAEVGGDRGEHVPPGERGARSAAGGSAASVSATARSAPPAIAAAGASSPLSGPTSTPSPPATSTATARRSVPTPGSTTASTTPEGRYWMARTRASEPARTSWGRTSWVRSMTVTWRARSRMTAFTTPTNSSAVP